MKLTIEIHNDYISELAPAIAFIETFGKFEACSEDHENYVLDAEDTLRLLMIVSQSISYISVFDDDFFSKASTILSQIEEQFKAKQARQE